MNEAYFRFGRVAVSGLWLAVLPEALLLQRQRQSQLLGLSDYPGVRASDGKIIWGFPGS